MKSTIASLLSSGFPSTIALNVTSSIIGNGLLDAQTNSDDDGMDIDQGVQESKDHHQ